MPQHGPRVRRGQARRRWQRLGRLVRRLCAPARLPEVAVGAGDLGHQVQERQQGPAADGLQLPRGLPRADRQGQRARRAQAGARGRLRRARARRRPDPQPWRAADGQEHPRARPAVDPDRRRRQVGRGRRRAAARGAARRGRRRLARDGRGRALGHRQHQDLRRVARAGDGHGRRAARRRRARPREQAAGDPARGAREAARGRRRQLLRGVQGPVRQPDESARPGDQGECEERGGQIFFFGGGGWEGEGGG